MTCFNSREETAPSGSRNFCMIDAQPLTGPCAFSIAPALLQLWSQFLASSKLSQAFAARGLICDVRPPDLLRFGLSPLYVRYEDVGRAVDLIDDVLAA